MAENKKGFLLYADIISTVRKLSQERQALLFMTILEYVNDENPTVTDERVDLVWEPIKTQLKRDLKKYEGVKVTKSNSGAMGNLKRWHFDLYQQVMKEEITIKEAESIAKHRSAIKVSHPIANVAVNDNVNDNDNDNVNDNEIIAIIPQPDKSDILFPIEHCLEIALKDNRWVSANKATPPDLKAFNEMLEGRGIYQKNPNDYKTHFHNWKKTGKQVEVIIKPFQQSSAPPLRNARDL